MNKMILRGVCGGVMVGVFISGTAFGMAMRAPLPGPPHRGEGSRQLTVQIEGVYNAKVSLSPFKGVKSISPIAEVEDVKSGQNAKIKIPAGYLPGEFLLRIDYRAKAGDSPYPAERIIFVNRQDLELTVNPPYINNDDKTKFNAGEEENTVYGVFMKENNTKRMPLDLLRQFLLSYDQTKSNFYTQGVSEFEQRRLEYNAWLSSQSELNKKLYVSHLFQFQYIPAVAWGGDEKERMSRILNNYFEGIDFSDTLIIRSRELAMFMDAYMGLYGMQATTLELRDSLFTQAGRVACAKASLGDPNFYGWIVDYFYTGYETYDIKQGMAMLQEHINNPRCLTSKKQQITQRLKGMAKLVPGALAPDFTLSDNIGKSFEFHKFKPKARQKLLLFWTTSCIECVQLVDELRQWYDQPANKKKLEIVAINLDEPAIGAGKWEAAIVNLPAWKHFQTKEGVNSPVAREYAILSTPVMFLVGSQNNIIAAVPGNLEQLRKELE